MSTEIKYQILFTSKLGRRIDIRFLDGNTHDNTIQLKCTAANLAYKDGDRDKYVPIRGSELTMKVLCNSDFTAENFLVSGALDMQVHLYVNDALQWKGYLDSSGLQKPLKDVNHEVQLIAKDGLHYLANKQIEYGTGTESFFNGSSKIIDYIAKSLSYTGFDFDIYAYGNIFPVDADPALKESNMFNVAYVNASTFYIDGKQLETCYEILNKIMHSFKCTLFQAKGRWNIVYWEQLYDDLVNIDGTKYDYLGVPQIGESYATTRISLGLTEPYKLINDDALITWEQPLKKVTTSYKYELPTVPIFNSTTDFKGDVITDFGNGVVWYDLIGWDYLTGSNNYRIEEISDSEGNLFSRYIATSATGIRSPYFLISAKQKFSISIDCGNGSGDRKAAITVSGAAGTNWLKPDGTWSATPFWTLTLDDNQVYSVETVISTPFDGYLYIDFTEASHAINNITVNINGFSVYDGGKTSVGYYVSRTNDSANLLNELDDDIYICDSLNRGAKGALLSDETGEAELLSYWKRNDNEESIKFQDIINEATWKMRGRTSLRMEGRIWNIYEEGLLNPLMLVNHTSYPTKQFQICTIDMDLKNETAETTLVECYDTEISTQAAVKKTGLINPQDLEAEPKDAKKPISWRWGPTGVIIQLITKKRWGKIR
jgi:hypothetical protein